MLGALMTKPFVCFYLTILTLGGIRSMMTFIIYTSEGLRVVVGALFVGGGIIMHLVVPPSVV